MTRHLAAIAAVIVTLGTFAVVADAVNDDPCAGHQTPDGLAADLYGPCDELPAVA